MSMSRNPSSSAGGISHEMSRSPVPIRLSGMTCNPGATMTRADRTPARRRAVRAVGLAGDLAAPHRLAGAPGGAGRCRPRRPVRSRARRSRRGHAGTRPDPTAAALRTRGLYRHVRHPIYSGLLLFGAAHTARSGSIHQVGILAALTGLLSGKARWEEARLRAQFPDYTGYALTTPRFVPRLRRGIRQEA